MTLIGFFHCILRNIYKSTINKMSLSTQFDNKMNIFYLYNNVNQSKKPEQISFINFPLLIESVLPTIY